MTSKQPTPNPITEEQVIAFDANCVLTFLDVDRNTQLSAFMEVYKQHSDAFKEKHQSNAYFSSYFGKIEEIVKKKIDKIKARALKMETSLCDDFMRSMGNISEELNIPVVMDYKTYRAFNASIIRGRITEWTNKYNDIVQNFIHKNDIQEKNAEILRSFLQKKIGEVKQIYDDIIFKYEKNVEMIEGSITEYVNDMNEIIEKSKVDSFEDEHMTEFIGKLSKSMLDTKKKYLQKCDKDFVGTSEFIKNYKERIEEEFVTHWVKQQSMIHVMKCRELLRHEIEEGHNSYMHAEKDRDKNPTKDDLMKLEPSETVIYADNDDIEVLKKISELCDIDLYYFGSLYKMNKSKITSVDEIDDMIKQLNVCGVKYGMYMNSDLQMLASKMKIVENVFVRIEHKDHSIYIFKPTDIKMFETYIKIIKALRHAKEIKEFYDISIEDIMNVMK